MKKGCVGCVGLLLAATVLLVFFFVSAMKNPMVQSGRDAFLFLLFFGEDNTQYSAGYSENAFWKVKPEMSEDEVLELLGEPISVDRGGIPARQYWRYTADPTETSFFFRVVVFGSDGKVEKIDGHYYVD